MIEHQGGEGHPWRSLEYDARIGSRALDMTLLVPISGKPTGVVRPLIPGLGARQEVYRNLAVTFAERGDIAALISYDGCSKVGIQAVDYALSSIESGVFRGQKLPISEADQIVPVAHSLGPYKLVEALKRMLARGSSIDKAIIEAAACMGGVDPWKAPIDAARSLNQERRYIGTLRTLQHHEVALDALRAMLSLRTQLPREVYVAMRHSIEDGIGELQDQGVQFAAVDHPDDLLVSMVENQAAYKRLGIKSFPVVAPLAGHVVPLYHSKETADAIELAHASITPKFQEAA